MKALEADIAQAESSRKERTMSVRYHKVKFFGELNIFSLGLAIVSLPRGPQERQKVVRKISQTTKKLSSDDLTPKSKKKMEAALLELRVDLNYIMVSLRVSIASVPRIEKWTRS